MDTPFTQLKRTGFEWGDVIELKHSWLEDGRHQIPHSYNTLSNKDYYNKRNQEIEKYIQAKDTQIELLKDNLNNIVTFAIVNNGNLIYIWTKRTERRKKIATNLIQTLQSEMKLKKERIELFKKGY